MGKGIIKKRLGTYWYLVSVGERQRKAHVEQLISRQEVDISAAPKLEIAREEQAVEKRNEIAQETDNLRNEMAQETENSLQSQINGKEDIPKEVIDETKPRRSSRLTRKPKRLIEVCE